MEIAYLDQKAWHDIIPVYSNQEVHLKFLVFWFVCLFLTYVLMLRKTKISYFYFVIFCITLLPLSNLFVSSWLPEDGAIFTLKSLLEKDIYFPDESCQNKPSKRSSKTCSHQSAWGVYSNKERQSWLMVVGTECMWGKLPFFYKLPSSKEPAISGHIMPLELSLGEEKAALCSGTVSGIQKEVKLSISCS